MSVYDLKCPKCGCTDTVITAEDDDWWTVECDGCGHCEGFNPDNLIPEMFPEWATQKTKLQIENAKLRSLCAEVAGILFNLDVDYCGLCDRDSINHPCPVHTVKGGECLIESELRELGVKVDA